MNLLVTGGCGFIGSNFLRLLLAGQLPLGKVETVVNLDLLTYAGNPENLADVANDPRYIFVQGDIRDASLAASLLEEKKIDAVVHFAAESHVDRSIDSPEPFLQTNVLGTLRLLEAARHYWNRLSDKNRFRFLHVSTDEVYGSLLPHEPAFSEKTPFAPNSPYAASKAASDHFARAYHHTYGLPVMVTNCSNNYGPYQFPEKLIPLMILNALEGKPLPIYGDGTNVRDWLYVEDHCRAVALALAKGKAGETYNIGGKNEMKNEEVVDCLCEILDELHPVGRPHKRLKTFVADRPGHDRRYAMNCAKIEKELSWTPQETFRTGIEKTVRWYLEHRAWSENIARSCYARERLGLK
ncbi:MAG: dTDP-glucose 4,6-dehydratase [bacterium]